MSENEIPELTSTEQARWAALKSVIGSVAEGVQSGRMTVEEAQAAQAQINAIELDMSRVRDSLHVPEDAGDYAEALEGMLRRIPDNWGRWISCSRGWYPLITRLDADLARLDPDYTLHQCKEKYGTLSYYTHTEVEEAQARFTELIREAARRSARTCELCGATGELHVRRRWFKTLCDACAETDPRGRWDRAKR